MCTAGIAGVALARLAGTVIPEPAAHTMTTRMMIPITTMVPIMMAALRLSFGLAAKHAADARAERIVTAFAGGAPEARGGPGA